MGNVKNISASVRERLKNIAKQSGKTFDLILLLYFQERLLYRLSISNYRDKFVLKGGLFLFSLTQFKSRPTKDIDFLARQISNDIQYIKAAFESICTLTAEIDVVVQHLCHFFPKIAFHDPSDGGHSLTQRSIFDFPFFFS